MVVARLVKLTVGFTWEKESEQGSVWHFGSVEGARKWVEAKDDVAWYSIEVEEFIPCNDGDPLGQLYIGCDYFDYVNKEEKNA